MNRCRSNGKERNHYSSLQSNCTVNVLFYFFTDDDNTCNDDDDDLYELHLYLNKAEFANSLTKKPAESQSTHEN